jgi:hypothetical protein
MAAKVLASMAFIWLRDWQLASRCPPLLLLPSHTVAISLASIEKPVPAPSQATEAVPGAADTVISADSHRDTQAIVPVQDLCAIWYTGRVYGPYGTCLAETAIYTAPTAIYTEVCPRKGTDPEATQTVWPQVAAEADILVAREVSLVRFAERLRHSIENLTIQVARGSEMVPAPLDLVRSEDFPSQPDDKTANRVP